MILDPKCYDIAEHFLPDNAAKSVKDELAQHIQDAIEMFLSVYDNEDEIPTEADDRSFVRPNLP